MCGDARIQLPSSGGGEAGASEDNHHPQLPIVLEARCDLKERREERRREGGRESVNKEREKRGGGRKRKKIKLLK